MKPKHNIVIKGTSRDATAISFSVDFLLLGMQPNLNSSLLSEGDLKKTKTKLLFTRCY